MSGVNLGQFTPNSANASAKLKQFLYKQQKEITTNTGSVQSTTDNACIVTSVAHCSAMPINEEHQLSHNSYLPSGESLLSLENLAQASTMKQGKETQQPNKEIVSSSSSAASTPASKSGDNEYSTPREPKQITPIQQAMQGTATATDTLQILEAIKKLEERINRIDTTKKLQDLTSRVSEVEDKINVHKQKLSVVSTQTAEYQDDQDKISIMMDLIIRQDQRINELSNQVLSLQARSMKRNIIINGLKEADKENCKETSINFLKNKMKIEDIDVEVAHCIGAGTDWPMVVSFKNTAEKSKVFGKVKNLKGVKNEDDKSYQIDDQLPEEMSEKKKQIQTHIKNTAKNIELSKRVYSPSEEKPTRKKYVCLMRKSC